MLNKWPCGGTGRTEVNSLVPPECHAYNASHEGLRIGLANQSDPWKSLKRPRLDESIDGDEEEPTQRKKRRLRLDLVTSRLSRPYADPATHIIGTKAWRAGAWARQRFVGGKLLRKAAILNWIAMKRKRSLQENGGTDECRSRNTTSMPHSSLGCNLSSDHISSSPVTPPAASDYDAFDYEEDDFDHEETEDDEKYSSDEDGQPIHSDFRLLESDDTDPEFFDTSWSFVNTQDSELESSRTEIKLVMENERRDEVSVAPTRLPDGFVSLSASIPIYGV